MSGYADFEDLQVKIARLRAEARKEREIGRLRYEGRLKYYGEDIPNWFHLMWGIPCVLLFAVWPTTGWLVTPLFAGVLANNYRPHWSWRQKNFAIPLAALTVWLTVWMVVLFH